EEARDPAPRRSAPLRAYSEFMPPPWVGEKPYEAAFAPAPGPAAPELAISEYEQARELPPRLDRVASHLIAGPGAPLAGRSHPPPRPLLADNPAWPEELAAAAAAGRLADDPIVLALPLALSRTQDDLGNVRWTLFGASHDGAA